MVDDKKDGPAYLATKRIQAVVVPGEPVSTAEMFRRIEATMLTLADGIAALAVDLSVQAQRISLVEAQRADTSLRVRATSAENMSQDAAIAKIVVDVASVAQRQEEAAKERAISAASIQRIERAATDVLSSPKVKAVGWALWLAFAAWLTAKGVTVKP